MASTSNQQANSGGIGFSDLLTILFIGLKLTNYIDWSWWWVLAPAWVPVLLVVFIATVAVVTGNGKSLR